jgi:hypothetical protein
MSLLDRMRWPWSSRATWAPPPPEDQSGPVGYPLAAQSPMAPLAEGLPYQPDADGYQVSAGADSRADTEIDVFGQRQPSMLKRAMDLGPETWFQIAGGFLAPEANMGTALWNVGQSLGQRRERMERKEDRAWQTGQRERVTADQQRVDAERAALEDAIALLPEDQQRWARANPQAFLAAKYEQEAAANAPITPYQRAQLGLQARGLEQEGQRWQYQLANPNIGYGDQRALAKVGDASDAATGFDANARRFVALNENMGTGVGTGWAPTNWIGQNRATREEMEALTSAMISQAHAMSGEGGVFTEGDAARFERYMPSVNKTRKANSHITDFSGQASRNAQDRTLFYESWLRDPRNRGSLLGARSEWNRYINANPILDKDGNIRTDRPGFEEWVQAGAPDMRNAAAPRSTQTGIAPPAAAVAELRRDTSAQARREFDEIFGEGAAERELRRRADGRDPRR